MNDAIQKLVEMVQKASPVVWQAAYRQVYIDGTENALLVLLFISVSLFLANAARKRFKKCEYDHEVGSVVMVIGSVGSACLALIVGSIAVDCFVNPTFAAIKQLKSLI